VGLSYLDRALWLASSVLAGLVVWRIIQQRLFVSPFRALGVMLGVVLVRDAVVSIPSYDTHAYALTWAWTLPALLAAQVWVGLDTLRAVALLYPKIGRFAVRLFLTCLAVTVVVCCLGLPFELHRLRGEEAALRALFLLHRSVDSWIAGTLVLVAVFFARFPAPLKQPPRNLVLHTILLSLYFGGYAALFFVENLASLGSVVVAERLEFILIIGLYSAWAMCLSKKGETSEPWPEIDVMVLRTLPQGR
jgi:hypothetical protein